MKLALVCGLVALLASAVVANPNTMIHCDSIDQKVICRFKDLKQICQISDKKCKRLNVSFYADPSLEITQNTVRENSNYDYNHIYG